MFKLKLRRVEIKQNNMTAKEYVQKFDEIYYDAFGADGHDREKMQMFVKGLKDTLKRAVLKCQPKTYGEARDITMFLDKLEKTY